MDSSSNNNTRLNQTIQVTCVPEQAEVAASFDQHQMLGLVHIQAPALISDERASRAPIAVSAVIDRSGSMEGGKLALVKKTLTFVIRNLKDDDQLGLVAYDDNVTENLPLTHMNAEGRKLARLAVEALCTGGCTNLSGGLFGGLNQLQGLPVPNNGQPTPQQQQQQQSQPQPPAGEIDVDAALRAVGSPNEPVATTTTTTPAAKFCNADVTSVWLFTDGLANAGIQNADVLKAEVQQRLGRMSSPCSIFTFGFGSDHNSAMLNGISEVGNGMYYFVETEDKIPDAFSDCLGGLLSVVAQNLKLTLRPEPGCTLVKVHTAYACEIQEGIACVRLPDIYSEEERDIIVEFRLATMPPTEVQPVLRCVLEFFNVICATQTEATAELCVGRPAEPPAAQPVPVDLDRQRNRIRCTEAMERARAMAEKNELAAAQSLLKETINTIRASVTAADVLCKKMLLDLQTCFDQMTNRHEYRTMGCHTIQSCRNSHAWQRSCGTRTMTYQTTAKYAQQCQYYHQQDEEE